MLQRTLAIVFCIFVFLQALPAQTWPERLPADLDAMVGNSARVGNLPPNRQPASLADGQVVTNETILGPNRELLEPYIATRRLQGDDYAEWCLRWNKLQYYLAERRSIPPQTIRGWETNSLSFSQGYAGSYGFGRPARVTRLSNSSSHTREQVWRLGGYGGGPVNIYNPFVTRH